MSVRLQKIARIAILCERMEARARAYVEGLLATRRHTFTRAKAEAALKSSPVAA